MSGTVNRQIILAELPKGKLRAHDFKMREASIPQARDGEVLLRVRLVSLDAANRAWMQGETYRAATKAGSVMDAFGIAEVVESKAAGFSRGDLVLTMTGWQDYLRPARWPFGQSRADRSTHASSQRVRHRGPHGLFRPTFNRAAEGR